MEIEYKIMGIALISLVIMGMILLAIAPVYNVWAKQLNGKAELKEAEWNKQVQIEDALGKQLAAIHLAQAEIERAKGVAEANRIIAQSIDEQYLRYLFIHNLEGSEKQIIYVPTEANLPILEATRNQ